MLSSMRAVVTPQTLINDSHDALSATGIGWRTIMDMPTSLVDHFAYCVQPDEYEAVSQGMLTMLEQGQSVDLPSGGRATMGIQSFPAPHRHISWSFGEPLPGLAVVSSDELPIKPGCGFVAVHASITASMMWLQQHDIKFQLLQPYGVDALWVPLRTRDYGVGDGYYAMCVVTESIYQTTHRLSQLAAA